MATTARSRPAKFGAIALGDQLAPFSPKDPLAEHLRRVHLVLALPGAGLSARSYESRILESQGELGLEAREEV